MITIAYSPSGRTLRSTMNSVRYDNTYSSTHVVDAYPLGFQLRVVQCPTNARDQYHKTVLKKPAVGHYRRFHGRRLAAENAVSWGQGISSHDSELSVFPAAIQVKGDVECC